MSSFRSHAIAGILFALPFVCNVFYLFFALLGASIPDLDHRNNVGRVYSMIFVGILLSVLVFIYNGDILSCVILIVLGVIFYLSKHRGFTHTLIGICVLSFLFTLMFMGFIPVLMSISVYFNLNIPVSVFVFIVMCVIGYFVVLRRYLLLYIFCVGVYLVFSGFDYGSFSWSLVFCMFFVGGLSHLILDLWTPAGLSLFKPLLNRRFHRGMALILFILWLCASIFYLIYFNPPILKLR